MVAAEMGAPSVMGGELLDRAGDNDIAVPAAQRVLRIGERRQECERSAGERRIHALEAEADRCLAGRAIEDRIGKLCGIHQVRLAFDVRLQVEIAHRLEAAARRAQRYPDAVAIPVIDPETAALERFTAGNHRQRAAAVQKRRPLATEQCTNVELEGGVYPSGRQRLAVEGVCLDQSGRARRPALSKNCLERSTAHSVSRDRAPAADHREAHLHAPITKMALLPPNANPLFCTYLTLALRDTFGTGSMYGSAGSGLLQLIVGGRKPS